MNIIATENILISKNGKIVTTLCNLYQDRIDLADSLIGILPPDITFEEARKERISAI